MRYPSMGNGMKSHSPFMPDEIPLDMDDEEDILDPSGEPDGYSDVWEIEE